jgi:hypothetical protein
MKTFKMNAKLTLIAVIILMLSLGAGCSANRGLNSSVGSIVGPHHFNLAGWDFKTVLGDLKSHSQSGNVSDEVQTVTDYFSLVQQISSVKSQIEASSNGRQDATALQTELDKLEAQKIDLESPVEHIINKQITEVLGEQGIYNPFEKYIKLKISFPQLYFKLEEPPQLLVVSLRDRIEKMDSVLLNQDTTLQEDEEIESRVDKFGVSSLVVPLGGLAATYPSFVGDGDLKWTIDTITHEWVHQYLTFQPLGFLYLLDTLGISQNYEDATIDETVADMVGHEISAMVYEEYYPALENGNSQSSNSESDFFNQTMREIRKNVDEYLSQGQVNKAEQYMEAQRQYLASKGYYIRKLNQAYFAFYGTYADSPTSISPIGAELKQLRTESSSIKDFLDTVSTITNSKTLQAALSTNQQ